MTNVLGVHYLIDFYNCDSNYLTSVTKIKKVMIEISKLEKFNVVKSCFHQFKPYGVSGVLVLKESHFTIHTWPEYRYAAIDIFLCDININVENGLKFLCDVFSTNDYKMRIINRGVIPIDMIEEV